MGRTVKDKKTHDIKPVEKIELSEDHVKKRAVAAVLFLLIGAGLLVYCFMSFLSPGGGWTTIKASGNESDSSEFVFQYYLGANGANASVENKAITALYNEITRRQYCIFNDTEEFEGINNICTLNRNPNKEFEVDADLYKVFSLFKDYNSRYIYSAPVYSRYRSLFFCEDDVYIFDFDPVTNSDVAAEFKKTLSFSNDSNSVDIQLLGDNKVKLFVSREYLDYAKQEGITDFISLMWMKNAFATDYIAEKMIEKGYRLGSVSSYDGFVRNFDGLSDTDYSINLFDCEKGSVYQASAMQYTNNISIVTLRNFPLNSLDNAHYYRLKSGETRTPYLDGSDGMPRSAVNTLISYSKEKSCGEILLSTMPLYISHSLDSIRLNSLTDKKIYSVYFKDRTLIYNEENIRLSYLYDKDDVKYTSKYVK